MTREEIIDLLTLIAARDNRNVGRGTVAAWLEDAGDLPFDDARRAVAEHFREEPDTWLMAGHLRRRVKALRENRLGPPGPGLSPVPPPADPDDPTAYLAALREQQARIADGRETVPAIEAAEAAGYDDNPHVARIRAQFDAERQAARARKAEEQKAERAALMLYTRAVSHLLDQKDHGAAALAAARDHLLGDAQAALGFPDLQSTPGVMDEHKVTVWAARSTGWEEPCAPTAD